MDGNKVSTAKNVWRARHTAVTEPSHACMQTILAWVIKCLSKAFLDIWGGAARAGFPLTLSPSHANAATALSLYTSPLNKKQTKTDERISGENPWNHSPVLLKLNCNSLPPLGLSFNAASAHWQGQMLNNIRNQVSFGEGCRCAVNIILMKKKICFCLMLH